MRRAVGKRVIGRTVNIEETGARLGVRRFEKIEIVVSENVSPRNADGRDRIVEIFKNIEVVENDVAESDSESGRRLLQLDDAVVCEVINLLQIPRLRIAENENVERIGFLLWLQGEFEPFRPVFSGNPLEKLRKHRIARRAGPVSRFQDENEFGIFPGNLKAPVRVSRHDIAPVGDSDVRERAISGIEAAVFVVIVKNDSARHFLRQNRRKETEGKESNRT